jgi:hypothetical protein
LSSHRDKTIAYESRPSHKDKVSEITKWVGKGPGLLYRI